MYITREITKKFMAASRLNTIVTVVGPRQAGKTTFLKAQAEAENASYLFFDDPDVKELFDVDIKRFENQYVSKEGITILDEIQYGKDPGRKLKYLADKGEKIWITSSSQILLRKDVLGWLVGRVSVIKLYQFSLGEFLSAKGLKEPTSKTLYRSIEEHMVYGGYPKVVLAKEKQDKESLLRDLYETMVLKDIARTFKIEDISALERLSTYLSHCISNVISYDNICKDLGLSFQSVKKYIDAMEKSYLILRVQPFYRNKLKEIIKQPKLYFIDTGMRNSIAKEFNVSQENKGKLFENYVMSELIKVGKEINYWQTKGGAEVDFIVRNGSSVVPIEVKAKADPGSLGTGMNSFISSYKPKTAYVVFLDGEESTIKREACTVKFVTIKTLLSDLG